MPIGQMMEKPQLLPLEDWLPQLHEIRRRLGQPLNIHKLMAHHAGLMQAWMPFRDHIVANSSLVPRQRELVILRTAVNCRAGYEWDHHVVRGRDAGLTTEEIARIKLGADAIDWQPADALLIQAADECHADNKIGDAVLEKLSTHFDKRQILDVIATVGMYITLAVMINTFDVTMEQA
jgi:alkylhydroperoxidase family enzyme